MTYITKNTYINDHSTEKKGYVEVGYYKKRAYVEHGTAKVYNPDGVPENLKAMQIACMVALDY